MSGDYLRIVVITIGINAILAASLHLINGLAGQFSIGHAALMAVGAYAASKLTLAMPTALGFALALPLAALAAGAAGLLVGAPSLRLRGDYLALATLGFGEIIRVVIESTPYLGGALGLSQIPAFTSLPLVAAVLAATIYVAWAIEHSRTGRALVALRDDELCAELLGIRVARYKIAIFVVAAAFAGLAGALEAHLLRTITPVDFGFARSFQIATMVVLGGIGSLGGAVFAATALTLLGELLRQAQVWLPAGLLWLWPKAPTGLVEWLGKDYRMLLYAGLLVAIVILRPDGLLGPRRSRLQRGRP